MLVLPCFCGFQSWSGNRAAGESVLDVLIGDSRQLFANQFFTKADVYFHSGFYPSMFDQALQAKQLHIEEQSKQSSSAKEHDDKDDLPEFLKTPTDWIDRFGRNFFLTEHRPPGG